MVNYRRNKLGNCYFFTVTLRDRRSKSLIKNINLLKAAMYKARSNYPFYTKAIVVLPDHIHAIWELPDENVDYSIRWRMIKSYFTKGLIKKGINLIPNSHGEYDLWQRRFWEHTIKNEIDLNKHIDYIHYNPVKHSLVDKVSKWPYSSFHRYVRQKILDINWAGNEMEVISKIQFGG